jgi:mono/diheme cytochrome c family protein
MRMSPRTLPAVALIGAVLLVACVSTPEPSFPGDAAEGLVVAQAFCASCHAIGQLGASPDRAAPPFREILAHYAPEQLAADLRNSRSISYLHMPQFFFGERHPDDLVAYLKTLQSIEPPKAGKTQSSN